tara:strand:+ start:1136 stop:1432 length:297 start_codon:yes stop_codon:yes gene_type:complete
MSKLSNIAPSKNINTSVNEKTKQEVLGFCASKISAFVDPNFPKDPIHKAINFLAEGKNKQANEIIKIIREKAEDKQYITEEQEKNLMDNNINEREKIK